MKMKAGLVTFFGSGKAQSINLAVPTYIYCTTHTIHKREENTKQ